jgi:uncharacterized damage-inducible protein DinB
MAELLDPAKLLEILEGNRRLTTRTIQAFSEEDLFQYTPVEPMRPFEAMVREIIAMEDGYVRGIATGEWVYRDDHFKSFKTKAALLAACEAVRAETRQLWPRLTAARLLTVEQDPFYGGPQPHFGRLLYGLENEIHHRAQGFVYLRMRGTEPPFFWER